MTADGLRYESGTKLIVNKPFSSDNEEGYCVEIHKGEIVEVLHSKEWNESYYFKGFIDEGFTPTFVENPEQFKPLKINNWKQEMEVK